MTGGSQTTFTPLAQLTLPPSNPPPSVHPLNGVGTLPASFCTAFSPFGSKFAVASQEGMVAVWDVRSRKLTKVFTTDRTRPPLRDRWNGEDRDQGDGYRQRLAV